MKTKIFALSLLIFSALVLNSQTPSWQWAKQVGSIGDNNGSTGNEVMTDVKTDNQGNVYAVGYFYSNPIFNNAATSLTVFSNTGGYGALDAYLIKYNSCGKTLWWRRMGGIGQDAVTSLVIDNSGKVIISGYCATTFTLGGNNIQDAVISSGGTVTAFIARFDTTGNFIDRYNGVGYNGKIFITSQGDYFVSAGALGVKVNTLGVTIATYTYAAFTVNGVCLDNNDNVYLSGYIDSPVNIGGGTTLTPMSAINTLIMKYSPTGTMLWYKCNNTNSGLDNATGIAVDATGNVVVVPVRAGGSGSTVFGYPVNAPVLGIPIFFLNSNTGSVLSVITGTASTSATYINPCYTDINNKIHAIGTIRGSLTFGSTTFSSTTNVGQNHIDVIDPIAGSFLSLSVQPQQGSQYDKVKSLDMDGQGNIYIAGIFGGILDSAGTAVVKYGGNEDGFVAKFGYPCSSAPTNTVPNAPLALTAVNNGSLSNHVAWTDNSNNEANFDLHYSFGGSTTYSLLATLPANTISYTHTGLSYTTTYCYKVAATNSIDTSAFSNTDCATTPAAPTATSTPNAPLNLSAVNNGSLTNNVAWNDNSSDETNFELHYTFGSSTTYSLLATLAPNTTSYAHTGLSYTTTYCYKVAATNSVGSSAFSNTACATTPAAPNSTIGIAEQNLVNSLSVYPNPTSGEITLHFVSTGSKTKVEVFDLTGKIVYTEIINTTQGENTRKFNLPKEKGLYAVKLSSEQAVVTRRVVVE